MSVGKERILFRRYFTKDVRIFFFLMRPKKKNNGGVVVVVSRRSSFPREPKFFVIG